MEKIKVLIVDDSAFMRRIIQDIFAGDARFTVAGTARDGIDALEKIARLCPQLVTLDIEMPRLNGLQTLREIVQKFKIPVIMISSQTQQGSGVTVEALSLGAVDFVPKPQTNREEALKEMGRELLQKAVVAAEARICLPLTPAMPVKPIQPWTPSLPTQTIVTIGASTGGPRALEVILTALPQDLPSPVLVTQHMPAHFTRALAERLNKISKIRIKEAEQGEPILAGVVYFAPGDFHMEIDGQKRIRLNQNPPVEHVRPSATVMMKSVAQVCQDRTIGVILTGMGKDGAAGMTDIKQKGGITIVQDEASAVIFSMPRAAIQAGAVDRVLPLEAIAEAITSLCRRKVNGTGNGL